MTDTHEKLMEQARSIAYEANECCARMDGYEEGIRDFAFEALSKAHQDGIREGKRQAAEIANNHSFACDVDWWLIATKKEVSAESCWSVARAILSTITDESE